MKSKGQWLSPFIKVCSHLHAVMQITSLSFSLSFNVARAPPHVTYACMVPDCHSFLRTRWTASSSCKNFQLVPTSSNCFQLSFICLLLGCTLDSTSCNCLQLPATTLICLLLSCALILIDSNWSQLLPPSCKSLHLLAVKTVHWF